VPGGGDNLGVGLVGSMDPCGSGVARFAELGATVFVGSPADFGRFLADETEKWAKVVKFAGIKPN